MGRDVAVVQIWVPGRNLLAYRSEAAVYVELACILVRVLVLQFFLVDNILFHIDLKVLVILVVVAKVSIEGSLLGVEGRLLSSLVVIIIFFLFHHGVGLLVGMLATAARGLLGLLRGLDGKGPLVAGGIAHQPGVHEHFLGNGPFDSIYMEKLLQQVYGLTAQGALYLRG